MEAGRIIQIGTPQEIYQQPASPFVADFVGSNNIFEARVLRREEKTLTLRLAGGVEVLAPSIDSAEEGHFVKAAIRPEEIILGEANRESYPGECHTVEILDSIYQGARHVLAFRLGDVEFQAELWKMVAAGQALSVRLPREAIRVFA